MVREADDLAKEIELASKRFKGLLCAYCSKLPAVTGDHIFAREFFLQAARNNLPQAPTCTVCNNKKSKLEHYLTTVLPFGGRHSDALENLASMVPKRLRNNARLHRQILVGNPREKVPLDGVALEQLFGLIARGLIWYHWKLYLDDEKHAFHSLVVTSTGARLFEQFLFNLNAAAHVNDSVGNDTFRYEGKQGTNDPAFTVWRFSIYGGLVIEGDATGPLLSQLVVVSGPVAHIVLLKQMLEQARAT